MFKKLISVFATAMVALSMVGCTTANAENPAQSVLIANAWIRSSEATAKAGGMTGVFGTFTNKTDHTVTITGGNTDISMMVQTHEVVGGSMQMKHGGIQIPAGKSVTLEPGGLHIMLMNLAKPILAGDKVSFTFNFEGASSQTLTLTAKVSSGGDEKYNSK